MNDLETGYCRLSLKWNWPCALILDLLNRWVLFFAYGLINSTHVHFHYFFASYALIGFAAEFLHNRRFIELVVMVWFCFAYMPACLCHLVVSLAQTWFAYRNHFNAGLEQGVALRCVFHCCEMHYYWDAHASGSDLVIWLLHQVSSWTDHTCNAHVWTMLKPPANLACGKLLCMIFCWIAR